MRRTPLARKPMKRTVRSTGPTRDVVDAVLERDQHSCVVCGNNLRGDRGRDWSLHRSAGYECSESRGHDGPHVAASTLLVTDGGQRRVLAVWHD